MSCEPTHLPGSAAEAVEGSREEGCNVQWVHMQYQEVEGSREEGCNVQWVHMQYQEVEGSREEGCNV